MKEGIMIKVNGISVKVDECNHCEKSPSEKEVEAAVARAQEMRECGQFKCGYCGESIKATAYRVYHDSEGWRAVDDEIEPCVSLRVHRYRGGEIPENNGVHLRCLEAALPHLNGLEEALKEAQ